MRAIIRAFSCALTMVTLLDASIDESSLSSPFSDQRLMSPLDTTKNVDSWWADRNEAHDAGASAPNISDDWGARSFTPSLSHIYGTKSAAELAMEAMPSYLLPFEATERAMKDPESALRLLDSLLGGWANHVGDHGPSGRYNSEVKLASSRSMKLTTSFNVKLASQTKVEPDLLSSSITESPGERVNSEVFERGGWRSTPPTQIQVQPIQAPELDLFDMLFFDMGGIFIYECIIGPLFFALLLKLGLDVGTCVCICWVGLCIFHGGVQSIQESYSTNFRDDFWEATTYHAFSLSLVGSAVSCLCFALTRYKEQKNHAIAMQFVRELLKQERKGQASTQKQRARATRAAAPARQRKERSATKRGVEEPASQASEPAAATVTEPPKRRRTPRQRVSQQKNTEAAPSSRHQSKQPMPRSPSSSDSSNNAEQSDLCVVCLDSRCTHVFVPCGHLCVCSTCADMVIQTDLQECPMCRVPSQCVMRVYTI